MDLPLQSVPNFSEGRDASTIDALGAALAAYADLLDVHSDADHHRSVFTLVGDDISLVEALLAGIACARERIDLRDHEGAHPRIGAADVVPIVALDPADRERAKDCALRLADRIGSELGLPVFLYGESSAGRGPAFYRRGGPAELQRRIDAGEVSPDFGPGTLDDRAGGVIVGARNPLIAFNVNLATDDITLAQRIAETIRESSGGLPAVQAMAVQLENPGQPRYAQVSMYLVDWETTGIAKVVSEIRHLARQYGADIDHCELIGLAPAGALLEVAADSLALRDFNADQVLELRLAKDR